MTFEAKPVAPERVASFDLKMTEGAFFFVRWGFPKKESIL